MSESVPQNYVVDDDVSVGSLIRSAGLSVRTFSSAQETLASLRKELPNRLVLDIQLPDINGFELQQELATKDVQIPIIILWSRRHSDVGAGNQGWSVRVFDKEDEHLLETIGARCGDKWGCCY
jgi:two-component system, LuxR family, response regulator FixJ